MKLCFPVNSDTNFITHYYHSTEIDLPLPAGRFLPATLRFALCFGTNDKFL